MLRAHDLPSPHSFYPFCLKPSPSDGFLSRFPPFECKNYSSEVEFSNLACLSFFQFISFVLLGIFEGQSLALIQAGLEFTEFEECGSTLLPLFTDFHSI